MEHYRVACGIKLFERKCKLCPNTYWVPKSSPQEYCSEMCHDKGLGRKDRFKPKRYKCSHKLKRSDYEES